MLLLLSVLVGGAPILIGCNDGQKENKVVQNGAKENKKGKVPGGEEPRFSVNALDMVKEFVEDEKAAVSKYKDKVIVVTGEVSNVQTKDAFCLRGMKKKDSDILALDVQCALAQDQAGKAAYLGLGQKVKVVGQVHGLNIDTSVLVIKCSVTELELSKVITVTAAELADDFERDITFAEEKYKRNDIIVSGAFEEMDHDGLSVILAATRKTRISVTVGAVYDRELSQVKKGQQVELRGSYKKLGTFANNRIVLNAGSFVSAK